MVKAQVAPGVQAWVNGPSKGDGSAAVDTNGCLPEAKGVGKTADARSSSRAAGLPAGSSTPSTDSDSRGVTFLIQNILDNENMDLDHSVWDCALLIGVENQGHFLLNPFQSCMIMFVGAGNVAIQAIVCLAIITTMAKSDWGENAIAGILQQRLIENHHWDNTDFGTMTTRARELCNGHRFNRLGGTYSDVVSYLGKGSEWGVEGSLICSLALLIWILSMTTEFVRTFELAWSVLRLPNRGRWVGEVETDTDEDCYVVIASGVPHKVFCLAILVLRLTVAFLLLYHGLVWLADTMVVSDLILNACALEIVKNVDEMLFSATFSWETRLLLSNTRLWYKSEADSIGFAKVNRILTFQNFLMVCRVGFIVGWFLQAYYIDVMRFRDKAMQIENYVCGGHLDFTYSIVPATEMPAFSMLKSEENDDIHGHDWPGQQKCFYAARYDILLMRAGFPPKFMRDDPGVKGMLDGTHPHCRGKMHPSVSVCPNGPPGWLAGMRLLTRDEYVQERFCEDSDFLISVVHEVCSLEEFRTPYTKFLHRRNKCADFRDICGCYPVGGHNRCQHVQKLQNVTKEWLKLLVGMCPRTCKACRDPPLKPEPEENNLLHRVAELERRLAALESPQDSKP